MFIPFSGTSSWISSRDSEIEQRFPKWISHGENNTWPSTTPGSSLSSSEHLGIVELIGKSRHICHRAQVVPCRPTTQTAHIPDVLFRQLSWWIELHEAVHRGEIAAGTRPGTPKFQLWSSQWWSPQCVGTKRHSTQKVLKDFRKVQCYSFRWDWQDFSWTRLRISGVYNPKKKWSDDKLWGKLQSFHAQLDGL